MRRLRNNSSSIVLIVILLTLATFAGPNALPRLLSNFIPFVDEGPPCERLRSAENRDQHQSYLGRLANQEGEPLSVRIDADDIPNELDGELVIRIIVTNESIGTVPIVYPGDIIVNNTALNGIGLVFNSLAIEATSPQAGLIPDSNIKLLAPRQRCVEHYSIPVADLANRGIGPNSTVQAYYRNTTPGSIAVDEDSVFSDQGLWVGVAASNVVALRTAPISVPTIAAQ